MGDRRSQTEPPSSNAAPSTGSSTQQPARTATTKRSAYALQSPRSRPVRRAISPRRHRHPAHARPITRRRASPRHLQNEHERTRHHTRTPQRPRPTTRLSRPSRTIGEHVWLDNPTAIQDRPRLIMPVPSATCGASRNPGSRAPICAATSRSSRWCITAVLACQRAVLDWRICVHRVTRASARTRCGCGSCW